MTPIQRIALAALLAFAALAPARAQVNLEDYLREDGYESIKISPDGEYYAATLKLEDRGGIAILRRSDKKLVGGASGSKNSLVQDFWWTGNDRVVMSMAEQLGNRDQPYATGALYSVGIDGKPVKILVGPKPVVGLVQTFGDTGPWEMATLIDPLPKDPQHALIATWKAGNNPETRVEKIDVRTGGRVIVASAPVRGATFTTDVAGTVRFARGSRDDNYSKLYYREDDESPWRLINDEAESGRIERVLGFSADGTTAYLDVTQSQGPDAVIAWNTKTNARDQVQRHATVDPYLPVYDKDGRTLIGMQYMADKLDLQLFDDAAPTSRMHKALARAFPDNAVAVTSYARDGQLALVQVWNDRTPGDTYIFDTTRMHADPVFVRREWFDPRKLAPARAITVKARDGLALHGWLTPPRGATGDGPWPTVVMPHGGPFGIHDDWSFDDDTQLLSEAGYAVLRINFRGSGNYGWRFEQEGAQEWGARMQDDVTDATRWAIEHKLADPNRICIYGASYGGYAALTGAAREPDLYRCAVGYVGVYDLEDMHRDNSRVARWMRNWSDDWIGARDTLGERSPTRMAQQIKAPVLLVAGGEDTRAPIAHSKKMERALRSAGKPVETLYVDSEGHGFYTKEHRREFYSRLLEFLRRHLGGATVAAKAAPAAPGS